MDSRTGEIYPTHEAALDTGVPEAVMVTGPEPALKKLSKLITAELKNRERNAARRSRARRRMQRRSRRQNRGTR